MELYDYEKKHLEALRSTLAECTVLLKKDGSFPLASPCKIAAYGSGVRGTVKGGTGSGEVNSRYSVSIEEGLKNAGFTVTTEEWLNGYDEVHAEAKKVFLKDLNRQAKAAKQNIFVYGMGKPMPEPEYNLPLKEEGDAAIYVVSRISGEGNDRSVKAGDIYLTKSETRDILALNEKFEKFMLVLNVGGPVDLTPVKDVKNILVLSQLGVEIGTALSDILLGKANPSGKLTTTWASYDQYYPTDDFDDINDTKYGDGIYVGYRYFDTFGQKALYPFGYGLSYSEFSYDITNITADGETVTAKVAVENIGNFKGKESIQLYLTVPFGKKDHPYQELCGFAKTKELLPGEKQELTISFKLSDMSTYDEERELYFLEKGDYILRTGVSSKDTKIAAVLTLPEEVITLKAKNVFGAVEFSDLKAENPASTPIPAVAKRIQIDPKAISCRQVVYEKADEIIPEVEALSLEDAALINIGGFDPSQNAIQSLIGEASSHVCGGAGETTSMIKGLPYLTMSDGPAGLRLSREYYEDKKGLHPLGATMPEFILDIATGPAKWFMNAINKKKPKKGCEIKYQYCTAIPIGTAIAQSFNTDLAESYGDIVGEEMERFGVNLWLAPALNIHRSILCGRNFEYYSEDPLVAGKMAASITKGVQKHKGCGTTIKHFAANNKELNRYCNNSQVSERAMREIYTKGFGICVKESQPHALMTSYNLINGTHTAEHRGLIEDLLRAEYGYEGIVMTDWVIQMTGKKESTHRNSLAAQTAAAGGDLFMPGGKKDYENLLAGLKDGIVSEKQVRVNATRVYKMAKKLRE